MKNKIKDAARLSLARRYDKVDRSGFKSFNVIAAKLLTSSLLFAIRWRTMIISELRRIIGRFWVAQTKNVSFAPCTYARSTIVPALQVW